MSSPPDILAARRFDRHLRLAKAVTGDSTEAVLNKFVTQRVLLTGDPRRLATPAGRLMLLTSANLIARFCPRIDIALPAELSELAAEVLDLMRAIDRSAHAEFRLVSPPTDTAFAAVLSVGPAPCRTPVTTCIDSTGWRAFVAAERLPAVDQSDDRNPFGALMAAALGAAEVFKLLLALRPEAGARFGDTSFSVFDYTVGGRDSGPRLPETIQIPPTLLAGVGAVGNGFLLALSALPDVRGELAVVDRQAIDDDSNLNRYLLATEDDIDPERPTPKTMLAVRLFEGRRLKAHPFQESLEIFLERVYRGEYPRPLVVVSAVDNNSARDLLQKLWPTFLLEGATDATTSQVSRHQYGHLACLLCIHTIGKRDDRFSYIDHGANLSGLSREKIIASERDVSVVVTDDDIRQAPVEYREALAGNVGRPVCSVLTELQVLSQKSSEDLPVQPAVSFVSMASGLLAAAELVKYSLGLPSPLETFFQMDFLYPLLNALLQPVDKVKSCYCVVRGGDIDTYRRAVE